MTSLEDSIARHQAVLADGSHVLSRLRMQEVEVIGADLAIELAIDETVTGPAGALQGGLVATLADYVGGKLAMRGLEPGALAVTSDLTVHYLAPARLSAHARGTVAKRGKRTVVVRVDVHDGPGGPLAAVCTLQFTIVRPGG